MEDSPRPASAWVLWGWPFVALLSHVIMVLPVLRTWGHGDGEYFLTKPVHEAWGADWPVRVLLQVAAGLVLGMFTRMPLGVIAGASIIGYPVLMGIEGCAEPSSHNLAPIELMFMLPLYLPLPLAAVAGRRWLARPPG